MRATGGSPKQPAPKPSYLPPIWDDDEFMSGIMTMLKDRDVNPLDYDRKMDFWSGLIGSSSLSMRLANFCVDSLKQRFLRDSRLPACIPQVVENLVRSGEVQTLADWRAKHAGWVDWGMSKIGSTSSWLWGGAQKTLVAPDEQLLHIPTLKKQADRVVELMRSDLEADVDGTAAILSYSDMYDKCTSVIANKTNFDLVLEELTDRGEISVGLSKGERIIKFRDTGSNGPAAFSESDASVHDIRRTLAMLEKRISPLEQTITKLDGEVRACIRAGDKTKAASLLRKKKMAEKELSEKDGQCQRLLTMLHQIGSSKHNKEVIDAFKVGSAAFKDTMARHGLSPEKIDETMDEVLNATEEYRDISEALAQPINGIHDTTTELEGELEALLAADQAEKRGSAPATPTRRRGAANDQFDLPSVPTGTLGISQADSEIDYQTLERRLKLLQSN